MHIGQIARVTAAFLTCLGLADLERVKELALDRDPAAAARHRHQHGCVGLEQGTLGRAESSSFCANATRLRRGGEPDCLWMPDPFLERAQ